jgi:hypothetical protein
MKLWPNPERFRQKIYNHGWTRMNTDKNVVFMPPLKRTV